MGIEAVIKSFKGLAVLFPKVRRRGSRYKRIICGSGLKGLNRESDGFKEDLLLRRLNTSKLSFRRRKESSLILDAGSSPA
jgi:hypothetical protein